MVFILLLAAAALLGGGLGAGVSCLPEPRRNARRGSGAAAWALLALGLAALAGGLFVLGLCLWARSLDLTAVWNRFFPDRLSKLAGCGLLLCLCGGLGLLTGFLRAGGPGAYFRRARESRLCRGLWLALSGVLGATVLGCALAAGDPPPSPVWLNEIGCCNFQILDPDYQDNADYIELVNTGSQAVSLKGYFLSDDGRKRNRFRLPDLTLEPGEFVLLWADGLGTSGQQTGEAIHLNFSLSPGETLWFTSPQGVLLDRVTVPERIRNVSLSLQGRDWLLCAGTPGQTNNGAAVYLPPTLEPPTLSLASGFYAEAQTLTMAAAPGCEIHYTLDGSVPTRDSLRYTGPLTLTDVSDQPNRVVSQPNTTEDRSGAITEPVDKGTILRAACFDETGARSDTVTASYFIGDFSAYEGSCILSIVAAPADLFGNYGICVTGLDYDLWLANGSQGPAPWPMYRRKGSVTEREAVLQLWSADGTLTLDSPCGLRVQGDSSRTRPLKRFRLLARTLYGGSETFAQPIFSSGLTQSFTTRQDSKDVVAHALLSNRGLGGQEGRKANVFLNGEFYYTCYLRERYDEAYFLNHFGVDPEDLVLIDDDQLDIGTQEDYAEYRALMDDIAASDASDPAVYREICRRIDVESFASFVAANLYLNNTDWSVYKDCKLWRSRSGRGEGWQDGRWRWLIYDMDAIYWTLEDFFGDAPEASYDLFDYPAPATQGTFLEMPVFRELLRSPDFRALFARIWLELMNADCAPERAMAMIEHKGWPSSFWSTFLVERPQYAVDLLIAHIVPEGEPCALTLTRSDPQGGTVKLGVTAPTLQGTAWTGTWVTGVPLTLTAEPQPGWRFTGWQTPDGETKDPVLTVTPTGDLQVAAHFERVE